MLSDEVCYQCMCRHARTIGERDHKRLCKLDRKPCPIEFSLHGFGRKTDPPPEWCPYAFEHAVAYGMESVNIDKIIETKSAASI